MNDTALATVTREALSLPYDEQQELLNSIKISIHRIESAPRKKLNFDSYVIPCERANYATRYVSELRNDDRI